MFESLKHWFESIPDESKLFEQVDDEILHSALASLLYHSISLDDRNDGKERHEFDRLLQQELELDQQQCDHLYDAASTASADPHADLEVIAEHLKDKPLVRLLFMQKLLGLLDIHGVHSSELELFYETLHEVFPELHDLAGGGAG